MKVASMVLGLVGMACLLVTFTGCQTEQPGVHDTLGTYSAMVAASPDKVTKAARSAVEDMKLTNITSAGTMIDGKVTATEAQGDAVTIDITQAGDNVSKVTVRVGTTGDETVSQQIIARIKKEL